MSPPNFFFFKIVLAVLIPLPFHLRISLVSKKENLARILIRHFEVLLWYNTIFTGRSKVNVKRIMYTLHVISLVGNMLHDYSTISRPGNWYWCHLQSLFRFCSYMCTHLCGFVYVFIILCSFITCRWFNHRHHQDTELFHHHRDPSYYSFIIILLPLPHLPLFCF